MLRRAALTAAICALLTCAGCSGGVDAPTTVGPTAGADPEPTYEPTIPPYTSAIELSDEDRAQVDELMLLVDEWLYFNSGLSEEHAVVAERMEPHLSIELKEMYEAFVEDAEQRNQEVVGVLVITDAVVDIFDPYAYASLALCYEYDHWGLVDIDTGEPDAETDITEVRYRIGVVTAEYEKDRWVLQEIGFKGSSCDDL